MSGMGILETYQDNGSITKALVKNASGRARAIVITNANVAARFFLLHNKATAPVATDVPRMYFLVPAGTAAAPGRIELNAAFFGDNGLVLGSGVGWSISTTSGTFTDAATAADHTVTLMYS